MNFLNLIQMDSLLKFIFIFIDDATRVRYSSRRCAAGVPVPKVWEAVAFALLHFATQSQIDL
jgi:hypothetical protein